MLIKAEGAFVLVCGCVLVFVYVWSFLVLLSSVWVFCLFILLSVFLSVCLSVCLSVYSIIFVNYHQLLFLKQLSKTDWHARFPEMATPCGWGGGVVSLSSRTGGILAEPFLPRVWG